MNAFWRLIGVCCLGVGTALGADPVGVKLSRARDRIRVEVDGQLFTEYVFGQGSRPYLYPILDADGTHYTRGFPMQPRPGEGTDHTNHRSVWFAHGAVNGHDLWRDDPGTGRIEHDAILETTDGAVGVVRTRNRWVTANGTLLCTDETTIRIRRFPAAAGYLIDWQVTLSASAGPLLLGDTEEGCLGVRVNESLRVMHGRGKDRRRGTGQIVTSAGLRDHAAWGSRGEWCHYSGTIGGKAYGVSIFDHPHNPRHPTWWHVRDYGLFAANFLGQRDFEKAGPEVSGDIKLEAGGAIEVKYRILFHRGVVDAAVLRRMYAGYVGTHRSEPLVRRSPGG